MRSAAARSPSRTGPVLPTHERVDNWLGVRPARSCLRSRRDSRRTATRRRAASMARWPTGAGGPDWPGPAAGDVSADTASVGALLADTGMTGTVPLLNPEDTLAAYVRTRP